MSPEEKAAIRVRCEAATPGPHHAGAGTFKNEREKGDEHFAVFSRDCACLAHVFSEGDVAFYAAARTDVPALLAEVERLEALFDLQKQATVGAQNICMVEQRERELAERALEAVVAERDEERNNADFALRNTRRFMTERDAALADAARLRTALVKMARCWTGHAFAPPNHYMGHSESCGGKDNDAACSCASNQSRGAFIRGREAIAAALTAPVGDDALREFGLKVAVAVHENEGDGTIARSLPELVDAVLKGDVP